MSPAISALLGALIAAGPPPGPAATELPCVVADGEFRPLPTCQDEALQRGLEQALAARPGWRRLAADGHLAVGLLDLSDLGHPRYAAINGRTMMYAASLPKIAILLAAEQALEDGELAESAELRRDLHQMIRVSSNESATAVIDRLGYEKIAETLTDERYRLYDPERGGGLWVGKRYARSGPRVGDPLKNLSHAATVEQTCRFYYLLATGRLVSEERSAAMLEVLANPGLHHAFVGVLENRAPRARLHRKSGTWQRWHSDSVLAWGPDWRRYVLVALVEDEKGRRVLEELVPVAEALLRSTRR